MTPRRTNRGTPLRTDLQILHHEDDIALLLSAARGEVRVDAENRMQLNRLAREDLFIAGFGKGVVVTLLPRGERLVATFRGELPTPLE